MKKSALVVGVCAVGVSLSLVACGAYQESSQPVDESSSSSTASSAQESSASASSTQESFASASRAQESSAPAPSLDLSNQQDYERINSLISDFAKVWGRGCSYDCSAMGTQDYLAFATALCEVDYPEKVEHQPGWGLYQVEGEDDGEGEGALEGYRMRVEADFIAELVQDHFGIALDYGEVSAPSLHPCQFQEGYVYFGGSEGHSVQGVALATSLASEGSNSYLIQANVYEVDATKYDSGDGSYYAKPITDFEASELPTGALSKGTISLECGVDGSLRLESYNVSAATERLVPNASGAGSQEVSINSGEDACDYIVALWEARGMRAPQHVESNGVGEHGYSVWGYSEKPEEYRILTVFRFEVSHDGSIYDPAWQKFVDPKTMQPWQ